MFEIKHQISKLQICNAISLWMKSKPIFIKEIGEFHFPENISTKDFNEGGKLHNEKITTFSAIITEPNCKISFFVYLTPEQKLDEFKEFKVGPEEIKAGLELLSKCPLYNHHFLDFINQKEDVLTTDTLMQFVIYGEIIFE